MTTELDHTSLHRTAKYFMDNGRASSHEEAMSLLKSFGLTIYVGEEITQSQHHQNALLTLVNVARRTFLGGIDVVGLREGMCISALAYGRQLSEVVQELGGRIVSRGRTEWPSAIIGNAIPSEGNSPCWIITWQGWRGGVIPWRERRRLDEDCSIALAPVLAAAVCAGEAFAYHAGDHALAGHRETGLSLWQPGVDWLADDASEPILSFLPSRLWLIGLGNLGQAFAWLLTCLPYQDRSEVELVLQDFDRIARSNDSTSVLSFIADIGQHKARCVSKWLESRGFRALLEERRFGECTKRAPDEPGVALCGVDNVIARMALEKAGFDLIVEAGLGAGPNAFRSISMHSFPCSRTPEQIWSRFLSQTDQNIEDRPAYQKLKQSGMDSCGLAQLASRTVGVPFVGMTAAAIVIGELLRRLHGGTGLELASGSVASLEDFVAISMPTGPYPGSFVRVERGYHRAVGLLNPRHVMTQDAR